MNALENYMMVYLILYDRDRVVYLGRDEGVASDNVRVVLRGGAGLVEQSFRDRWRWRR